MSENTLKDYVIADTGASIHVCNNWNRYESVERLDEPITIQAGSQLQQIDYKGVMRVAISTPTGTDLFRVANAYYWPDFHTSAISNSLLKVKGWKLNCETKPISSGISAILFPCSTNKGS